MNISGFRAPATRHLWQLFAAWFLTLHAALAFFPEPNPLILEVDAEGIVTVKGSSGSAAVVLQQVIISDPDVTVSDFPPGSTRSGTGNVKVKFTGLQDGEVFVQFFGTNNGDFVGGSTVVKVLQKAATSAQTPQVATAGDPINTRTGEYFGTEAVDLNLGGPMPLMFARYVASKLEADGMADGRLGQNRLHNFASSIATPDPSLKQVILPSGRVLLFKKAGTKWVLASPLDVPFQLIETGGEIRLGHPHTKQTWAYSSQGRLLRIEDGKGKVHTLSYTGADLTQVSDGLGRTINLSYSGGRISGIVDHTGTRQVTYNYTGDVLTSVEDYGGHTTTYGNDSGLPSSVTRAEGNTLFSQTYTDDKVTSQTERGTDTSTLSYGPGSTTFTDPTNATLIDGYDANGRLITHTDEAGHSITMTYDSAGRRNAVTDRLGRTTTIAYHAPSGLPASITNVEGKTTSFAYKSRMLGGLTFHDLSKITWPDGASRSFTYDAMGNLTKITDETGKAWQYAYNGVGQVRTITNPLGGITTYGYNANCNLIRSQLPDEGETTYSYDARFRLTQITRPGAATMAFGYDTKDRITALTDERGKLYTYAYDTNNRLTQVTDPDSNDLAFAHDVLDRVASVTDRLNQSSSVTYDSRRQIASVTDRNGNTSDLEYDERQRLASIEDPGGEDWTYTYDEEGRLIGSATPIDPPGSIRRNHLGYPIEVSDPLGNTRRAVRDPMQRVLQQFDALGRQTLFTYDKQGRIASAAEQGLGAAKYVRDSLGNVVKITDPNGGSWNASYLKSGRIAKMTDPLGKSWLFEYDERGRPGTITYPDASHCVFTFDAASNLTRQQHSAGPDLQFAYDDLSRPISANGVAFSYDAEGRLVGCPQNGKAFAATYDNDGRLAGVTYNDGAFGVTYTYDTRDRLIGVNDTAGTDLDLAYDNAGRLTGITRASGGVTSTYTYDAAGRLTRIQDGSIIDLNYTLNAEGEVSGMEFIAPVMPAVASQSQSLKFGKAGEITSAGYSYDAQGRLVAGPGLACQWDGASRMVQVNGISLTYNGLGDLTARDEGGETTQYYHHHALGLAPIVFEDAESGVDRYYVWTPSGRLLYSVEPGTTQPRFYHFDRIGSTLAITDANGDVTDAYAYGPYGEPLAGRIGTSTQPFTYVGAFGVRQEGSLYHMRARYYDPVSGRFLSRDPLPPRLSEPKTLNRYEYALQNPLRYIDPQGTTAMAWHFLYQALGLEDYVLNERTRIESENAKRFAEREAQVRAQMTLNFERWKASRAATAPALPGGGDVITGAPGSGHSNLRTFVFPHALEVSGRITNTQNTFDTSLFMTYTPGLAGLGGEPGASVDLFLFDQATGGLLNAGSGASVCDPCAFPSMTGNRKLSVRVDDLITRSRTAFDAGVKLGFGVLVIGGQDADGINLQGFVVNAHTSPFDVAVFGFEPQPLAADTQ